ncbi:MAG: nicotinate-nucleotide adenylyltransferase [Alphaproteobacteria bacterium]
MKKKIRPPGPARPGLRIGLLGGSFNPAHEGHLHVTRAAFDRLGLDYVWWLVSPKNPLKKRSDLAPLQRRLDYAKRFARDPRIKVSAIERELDTRYTVDTVCALQRHFPQVRFVWLMGSDNLVELPRWRRWQRLFSLIPIAIVPRPATARASLRSLAARRFAKARVPERELPATPPAWTVLKVSAMPESATRIRATSSWNGKRRRAILRRKKAKGGRRRA